MDVWVIVVVTSRLLYRTGNVWAYGCACDVCSSYKVMLDTVMYVVSMSYVT